MGKFLKKLHFREQRDCKSFNGYKPCFPGVDCSIECQRPNPIGVRILIIALDAIGAVLQATSILPALKRKYPSSHISWITLKNALPLLENNSYIDTSLIWEPENWLILQQTQFDVVFNADKTKRSCAFQNTIQAHERYGFGLDEKSCIVPLNTGSHYAYQLGLDDELKFHKNTKFGTQILHEMFELDYQRDGYVLTLSKEEEEFSKGFRKTFDPLFNNTVVGINTGCSLLFPNKKMTIEQHLSLIDQIGQIPGVKIVLLGGPEDTERNREIHQRAGQKTINSPCQDGLRKGICYEQACDIVVTGDSLGMHIAIGLSKFVIAWFGLSCWSEIDLYDSGVKLYQKDLSCSPCWKRTCPYDLECIKMIDIPFVVQTVREWGGHFAKASEG